MRYKYIFPAIWYLHFPGGGFSVVNKLQGNLVVVVVVVVIVVVGGGGGGAAATSCC
jgi:hypothetical protein